MPKTFYRSERVGGLLRRELAQLIQTELKDLAHAKVYITVFEEEKAASSIKALQHSAGYLRKCLGRQLRMRNIPELHFVHDASVETGQKMDRLIETAVSSDRGIATDEEE